MLPDPTNPEPTRVRKVVLCSGKVYYDLAAGREEAGLDDVAVLRIEQLYPFPAEELADALARYSDGVEVAWVQEEPANMGPMSYLRPLLRGLLGRRIGLVSREPSASPATGSAKLHALEQQEIVSEALS